VNPLSVAISRPVMRQASAPVRLRPPMVADAPLTRRLPAANDEGFSAFVDIQGLRLRRILTARYGVETGGDIHAETMAWAWQNWAKLREMDNPAGYLYRVAQSSARPHHRWLRRMSFPANMPERWHLDQDSTLFDSLRSLSEAQRISVLMVHGHGETYADVAEVLGCSVAAVTNHVHRGLATLRRQLEGEVDE
jgi:DNA-directed RNA polymerase specialized sigma24 family protein